MVFIVAARGLLSLIQANDLMLILDPSLKPKNYFKIYFIGLLSISRWTVRGEWSFLFPLEFIIIIIIFLIRATRELNRISYNSFTFTTTTTTTTTTTYHINAILAGRL